MTLLLSIVFGLWGIDRFYLGKKGTAIAKLLTFGGVGYWWLIDVILTLCGGQRDQWGLRLEGYDRNKRKVWLWLAWIYGSAIALGLGAAAITASFDERGPTAFGWIALASVAVVGAATAAFVVLLRRRRRPRPAKTARTRDVVPARIRAQLVKLTELRALHLMRAASGDRAAAATVSQIDSLGTNVTELFRRLDTKATKDDRARAQVEYEDKLAQLASALDVDYHLDILANPRLWDDAESRIDEVSHAIDAVDTQAVENIRQVNAHRGIVFRVRLDALRGARGQMDSWQRDFDEASGPA